MNNEDTTRALAGSVLLVAIGVLVAFGFWFIDAARRAHTPAAEVEQPALTTEDTDDILPAMGQD